MANVLSWLAGREDKTGQSSPVQYDDGQPSLRAYNPSPSEQFSQWMAGLLGAGPGASLAKQNFATGVPSLLAASPLGIGLSAADLIHAKSANDPMGAAAAAIGMVPGLKPGVQAVRQGIRAYHGSPHDFEKFDLSKIGTGEGAQAYGHGLYFAEKEGVAKDYRDKLSGNLPKLSNRIGEPPIYPAEIKGKMYEVNINAKPEQFLDWDKTWQQQSWPVRERIEQIAPDLRVRAGETEGSDLYHMLSGGERGLSSDITGKAAARTSAMMREAGIPGIRYLDQGSRFVQPVLQTTPHGDVITAHYPPKTSNYVLFNDQLVDIMRKYGLAAPAAAGAASYAMQPQEAQAAKVAPAQFQQPAPLSDRINQMIDSLQWGDQW
jgi:hypothetical protein